jgi:hypothetical protein
MWTRQMKVQNVNHTEHATWYTNLVSQNLTQNFMQIRSTLSTRHNEGNSRNPQLREGDWKVQDLEIV